MNSPKGLPTMIGSVPHTDVDVVIEKIFGFVPNAPIWPQMPNRHWREGFLPQYSEGLPGVVENTEKGMVYIDTGKDSLPEEMASFYETVFSAAETGEFGNLIISTDASAGYYKTKEVLGNLPEKPDYVKVHITGPVSFGLTVTDENDRALYYNDDFRDIILKSSVAKAVWQVREYKELGKEVICFIDEPALSSFGSSAFINVTREDVVAMLGEAVEALHAEDAHVGVHVCGNSEWTILIDAGVDIINFDAFSYGEGIALYADRVGEFLAAGGVLAWGIVPTSDAVVEADEETLYKKLVGLVDHLAGHGIDKDLIWNQTIITPSCGMGTMSVELAELVMKRLSDLASLLQERIYK